MDSDLGRVAKIYSQVRIALFWGKKKKNFPQVIVNIVTQITTQVRKEEK